MAPDRDRFSDRKPQAKTGYKWRERFFRQGLEGMEEESRRPLSSPKQLSEVVVCEMVKLKLGHRYWGPRKIRTLYQRRHGQAPSESSFKRVLEQAGLTPAAKSAVRDEFSRYVLELRAMENARSQTVREAELYRDSVRRLSGAEVRLSYPGMATRLVDKNGKLSWKDQKVFLSGSLAGWEVGLQRTEKGQLKVRFGRLLLGHLDPRPRER